MASADAAFLYVIGEADGPHKVGLSTKPRRRLSELQCGTHRPLFIKKTSPTAVHDAAAVEVWAHHFMFEHRLRGEWFDVSADEAWKHLHAAEMAVLCNRPAPNRMPSSGKVGRPALRPDETTIKTTIRLPKGLHLRMEAVAGKGKVAAFIRQAAESALTEAEAATPRKPLKIP